MKVCVCDEINYWYKYKISNWVMNYMFIALFYLKRGVIVIVKTKYLKGISHKEYYVKYIATREGVEKF